MLAIGLELASTGRRFRRAGTGAEPRRVAVPGRGFCSTQTKHAAGDGSALATGKKKRRKQAIPSRCLCPAASAWRKQVLGAHFQPTRHHSPLKSPRLNMARPNSCGACRGRGISTVGRPPRTRSPRGSPASAVRSKDVRSAKASFSERACPEASAHGPLFRPPPSPPASLCRSNAFVAILPSVSCLAESAC